MSSYTLRTSASPFTYDVSPRCSNWTQMEIDDIDSLGIQSHREQLPRTQGIGNYFCNKCYPAAAFSTNREFTRHLDTAHSHKYFACPDCGTRFNRRDNFRMHQLYRCKSRIEAIAKKSSSNLGVSQSPVLPSLHSMLSDSTSETSRTHSSTMKSDQSITGNKADREDYKRLRNDFRKHLEILHNVAGEIDSVLSKMENQS